MFKCENCKLILDGGDLIDGTCPECGNIPIVMCEKDIGSCNHGVVDGIATCEICGAFICPICGAHDVTAISRITGYLSPVGNGSWNSAKVQELQQRHRYEI
jgi:anaerobic ribonucleoside-triphosphate reductase